MSKIVKILPEIEKCGRNTVLGMKFGQNIDQICLKYGENAAEILLN